MVVPFLRLANGNGGDECQRDVIQLQKRYHAHFCIRQLSIFYKR